MKSGTHPQVYNVVYLDTSTGVQFLSTSTKKSDETIKIDGKEYYLIKVEISSSSHPFYTGKQNLIDSAGRIDKFKAKLEKAQSMQGNKKVKEEKMEEEEEVKEVAEEVKEEKEEAEEQKEAEEEQAA